MNNNGHCGCNGNGPRTVDFQWLISECDDGDAVSVEMVVGRDASDATSSNVLFRNLERYGWSSIRLRWNDKSMEPSINHESCSLTPPNGSVLQLPLDAWQLLSQYPRWKELHSELFKSDFIRDYDKENFDKSLRFIPFESGAPGSSLAEAKQSWEYSRNSTYDNTSYQPLLRLRAWTELMHTLICHVMLFLNLPATHLVTSHGTFVEDVPLDLLRAFRYEPISRQETHEGDQERLDPSQLGSSPHTDWGSWTVVWQDDTDPPCLQTYCPECHQWNAVPSLSSSISKNPGDEMLNNGEINCCPNEANFIIHVGDLTSLCIRQAMNNLSTSSSKNQAVPVTPNVWPSPRHRVLSPIHQCRHSLVYFVYPRVALTPAAITESFLDWCSHYYFDSRKHKVFGENGFHLDTYKKAAPMHNDYDWTHYSILADQSSLSSSIEPDSMVYQRRWYDMQHTLVRDILKEKWRQVQR